MLQIELARNRNVDNMSASPDLAVDYQKNYAIAERLRASLLGELSRLVDANEITLGVPIESRVKSLASIVEKTERKSKEIQSILDFDDIVGVRIILLFSRDVARVKSLIEHTLNIVSSEDTAERLSEVQFGYQSQHYVVSLPKEWLTVPSFEGLGPLRAEIQVRSLAQHMWAAASHKLQYKHETSVPPPLRRAIHRVSALLETVDLEFERVLSERSLYIKADIHIADPNQKLNVDVLKAVLDDLLPSKNKGAIEPYASLLDDLEALGVTTVDKLRGVLKKHEEVIAAKDSETVARRLLDEDFKGTTQARIESGVFLKHVGWVRSALRLEFPEEAKSKMSASRKPAAARVSVSTKKAPARK